jgi:hypothetical protein
MGSFCFISFEVGVYFIGFSLLSQSHSQLLIMAPSACNQVMNGGSDLEGIRILFQDHLIPEFIPLSKVIQANYNGVIDDITVLDPLFFDTSIKDKLTLTVLDDLKAIIADLVVIRSSNDPTSKAGTEGKAKFLELPFK